MLEIAKPGRHWRGALILFLGALVFILGGCGKKRKKKVNPSSSRVERFVYVETTRPKWVLASRVVPLQGEIKSDAISNVGADVMGKVVALFVQEGDHVGASERILKIDDSDLKLKLQAANERVQQAKAQLQLLQAGAREEEIRQGKERVRSAQASYDLASKNERRLRLLLADGAISLSEMDDARTRKEQAAAELEQAKQALAILQKGARREELDAQAALLQQAKVERDNVLDALSKTDVRAPFSGWVQKLFVQKGEVVGVGTPLVQILGEPLYYQAELPEIYRSRVHVGQRVQLNGVKKTIELSVTRVLPSVSPESRTFSLRAALKKEEIPFGSFLTGELTLEEKRHLVVPARSVRLENGESFLFVVRGRRARRVKVEGKLVKEGFAVTSGVSSSDRIITSLSTYLVDGVEVRSVRAADKS